MPPAKLLHHTQPALELEIRHLARMIDQDRARISGLANQLGRLVTGVAGAAATGSPAGAGLGQPFTFFEDGPTEIPALGYLSGPRLIVTAVKTGAYAADWGELVRCDPSGGAFTVTLPMPEAAGTGRFAAVKNVTASVNAVTVNVGGGRTIDGAATLILAAAWAAALLVSDGTNWLTV